MSSVTPDSFLEEINNRVMKMVEHGVMPTDIYISELGFRMLHRNLNTSRYLDDMPSSFMYYSEVGILNIHRSFRVDKFDVFFDNKSITDYYAEKQFYEALDEEFKS